jgi:20S proteasome alpha/beta subunit
MITRLKFKINMYKMNEEREIKPKTLSAMISTMMYEKRYVLTPMRSPIPWCFHIAGY